MKRFKKTTISLRIFSLILALAFMFSQVGAAETWKIFETQNTTIQYRSDFDLESFSRRLQFNHDKDLTAKVDGISHRVAVILNTKNHEGKVKIRIYRSWDELNTAWERITGKNERVLAFYVHPVRTIFISLDQVTDGILAHEMAHHFLHSFSSPRPPVKVGEVMAQSVERYLLDDLE